MVEQYQELANAIVELAVRDYRKLVIGYHRITKQRNRARKTHEKNLNTRCEE